MTVQIPYPLVVDGDGWLCVACDERLTPLSPRPSHSCPTENLRRYEMAFLYGWNTAVSHATLAVTDLRHSDVKEIVHA